MSPVTRVVELLQGMTVRIEADGKAEEDLYENFVCWANSIISQKRASNAAAQSRVDSLDTYIKDLKSGRIELTTERSDLEKDIETLTGDIEIATQTRAKEADDFKMAKAEMDQAIAALTKAVDVLRTATTGHEDGVLMSLKGSLSESSQIRAQEAVSLQRAVELGKRVLTRGDSVFLQRLLTGEVPKVERASWKALNRNATFKMNYKARSFKIQSVLAKLQETFNSNLADAALKEAKAIELFNKLTAGKGVEKKAAEDALRKLEKENGAKMLSLADSTDEKTALTTQIADDTSYISQVQQALATKQSEWKGRQALRAGELAAIAKAISILHGDESRDLFKKSFASQGGFLFLQETASHTAQRTAGQRAIEALRRAARRANDSRLMALADLAASGQFDEVIGHINDMLSILQTEEAQDLTQKEKCESDRASDTRDAIQESRTMDELTDSITTLTSKVAELTSEIQDKEAQVAAINQELNQTAVERQDEHAEYLVAKKDDQDAASLVSNAKQVLSNFYKDNKLMLAQQKHAGLVQKGPFQSEAGKAPPPPPQTWKNPTYGGKTAETTGILAILDMIESDINADISKADKDEAASLALYTKTKTNLETERSGLTTSLGQLNTAKSAAEVDKTQATTDRSNSKNLLGVVMKKIKDASPGCDFVTINFHVRSQNRKVEMDGLNNAKAILSGGVFDGLPDPGREIKPGDALVQYNVDPRSKFLHRRY